MQNWNLWEEQCNNIFFLSIFLNLPLVFICICYNFCVAHLQILYLNLFHNFLLRLVGLFEAHFQLHSCNIPNIKAVISNFSRHYSYSDKAEMLCCCILEFGILFECCIYADSLFLHWSLRLRFCLNEFRIHHWNAIKIREEINEKLSSWFLIEQKLLKCERINDAFPYGFHIGFYIEYYL